MMSTPFFSYAAPNARRTERFSDTFAKMFSASMSVASYFPRLTVHVGLAIGHQPGQRFVQGLQ